LEEREYEHCVAEKVAQPQLPQAVVDIVITQQDQPMKEREAKPEQARVLMQVKRDMLFFLISVERSSSPHGC